MIYRFSLTASKIPRLSLTKSIPSSRSVGILHTAYRASAIFNDPVLCDHYCHSHILISLFKLDFSQFMQQL